MKHLALGFVLLFYLLAITCRGQRVGECNIGLESSPSLRGMKLGMSVVEIEKAIGFKLVFGSSKSRAWDYRNEDKELEAQVRKLEIEIGEQWTSYPLNYYLRPKKASLGVLPEYEEVPTIEGVSSFLLSFHNNVLDSITVEYEEKNFDWKGSREFARILSEKFKLPLDFWKTDFQLSLDENEVYKDESGMSCRGFIMTVQANGSRSKISIFDTKTFDIIQEKKRQAVEREVKRIKDAELEKKRKFRP